MKRKRNKSVSKLEVNENRWAEYIKNASILPVLIKGKTSQEFDTNNSFKNQSEMKKIMKAIASKIGAIKEYSNINLDFKFRYSYTKLNESVNKQFYNTHVDPSIFVRLITYMDEIIKIAIPIERHKDIYKGTRRYSRELDYIYVLFSAFIDKEYLYPVEIIIKKIKNRDNSIHLMIVLDKIKTDVIPTTNKFDVSRSAVYNLYDLIQYVKYDDFLIYIPDELLNDEQKNIKNNAIKKEKIRIEKYKY